MMVLDEKYWRWFDKTVKQCKNCGDICLLIDQEKTRKEN